MDLIENKNGGRDRTRTCDLLRVEQGGGVSHSVENMSYPVHVQWDTRIWSYSGILGFTLLFCVASPKFPPK